MSDPYEVYAQYPTKGHLQDVVRHYQRDIDNAVMSIAGRSSPVVRRRANILAAQAVQTYDPNRGVPMKQWIKQQLMPLHRMARQATDVITVPERVRRDQALLHRAREELYDSLDREPSPEEIADHTGVSLRRQQKLQRLSRPMMSENEITRAMASDDEDGADPGVQAFDPVKEWEDYVYHDLDDTDKQIFRGLTGYQGAPIRKGVELSRDLKISPAAITKRATKIHQRLENMP